MMKSSLSDNNMEKIRQVEKARQSALRKLVARERTEKEILDYLREAGCSTDEALEIIAEFKSWGYIDDEKYAEMLARELFLRKGWSLRRASFEMYDRGLPAELVEPQLAGYEDDEVERAAAVLEKKYLRKLSDPKGRRSALAALQRLGFAYPDTKEALSLILDELPEDGGEAED